MASAFNHIAFLVTFIVVTLCPVGLTLDVAGRLPLLSFNASNETDFSAVKVSKGDVELVLIRGGISSSQHVATSGERRLKLLEIADRNRIVQLIFDGNDVINECDVSVAEKAGELRRYVTARVNDSSFVSVTLTGERLKLLTDIDAWTDACQQFHDKLQVAEAGISLASRDKRAILPLVYPGTQWCGRGNRATSFDDLGEQRLADSCCRTHDHCPNVIQPLAKKFNYFNYRLYTISHCDCDKMLRKCLKRSVRKHSDSVSQLIGHLFFNVVAMPCFTFEDQEVCTERSWWGTCIKSETLVKAKVANRTLTF